MHAWEASLHDRAVPLSRARDDAVSTHKYILLLFTTTNLANPDQNSVANLGNWWYRSLGQLGVGRLVGLGCDLALALVLRVHLQCAQRSNQTIARPTLVHSLEPPFIGLLANVPKDASVQRTCI